MGFLSGCNEHSEFARLKWSAYDMQIKQKLLRLVNPDDSAIHTG